MLARGLVFPGRRFPIQGSEAIQGGIECWQVKTGWSGNVERSLRFVLEAETEGIRSSVVLDGSTAFENGLEHLEKPAVEFAENPFVIDDEVWVFQQDREQGVPVLLPGLGTTHPQKQ
jgi:hypothetical protein